MDNDPFFDYNPNESGCENAFFLILIIFILLTLFTLRN